MYGLAIKSDKDEDVFIGYLEPSWKLSMECKQPNKAVDSTETTSESLRSKAGK